MEEANTYMEKQKNQIEKIVPEAIAKENISEQSQAVFRLASLISSGVMVIGLIGALIQNSTFTFPGPSTLQFTEIVQGSSSTGLILMSSGIVLFALLPSLRVLLGIKQFVRNRDFVSGIFAAIVLTELAASVFL